MPGMNLTRDEARERAGLLAVDVVRRQPRPHHGPRHVPHRHHGAVHLPRAGRLDVRRPRRRLGARGDAQRREPRPGRRVSDGVRIAAADLAAEQRADGRRRRRLHEHRRGAAPVRRPGRRRGLPLHAVRGHRLAAGCSPCFEQPDLKATFRVHGDRAAPLAGRLQLADARAHPRRRGGRRASATWAFAPTPRISCVHHRARRRPVPRRARRGADARAAPSRWASSAASRWPRTSTPTTSSSAPSRGSRSSRTSSTSRTRSTKYDQLFVPEYNAGAMENAGAVTFIEDYVFRAKVTEAMHRAPRPDDPARAGPHVVRRPRDHALVGRPVAQRVVRRVGLHQRVPGRGHRVDQRLDDVRHRREVLGLPPGPAALDPPDRRRHPRPRRRRGQLRRHHLRQGRLRAQAARGLRGSRALHRRACAPTSPSTPGRTPPWPTCSPSWSRPPAATCRPGPSSGWRPPGSTPCGPRSRSTTSGVITAASITQTAAEGFPTLRPHRLAVGLYDRAG